MQKLSRRFTLISLITILGLLLVACGNSTSTQTTTKNSTIPSIPNITGLDAVFFSTDNFDVTYRDLYNSVKINDGIHQLIAMVDLDLLSGYYDQVTETEIDEKIKKLTYNTTDQEEIAALTEEEKLKAEATFVDNMYLRGYTDGNYEVYFKIVIAREKYATELMLSDESIDQVWHVGPKEIANYYTNKYNKEIKSIKIKFESETDAQTIMRSYNLITKDSKLMLYTGTTPIEEVPSFAFNETNTRDLTEAEIFEYYLNMYNDVYGGYRDEVASTTAFADLLAIDEFTVSYDEISKFNANLTKYIFTSLNTYSEFKSGTDTSLYYSYRPEKFYSNNDTAYYMILNLQEVETADVSDFTGTEAELITLIGEAVYQEIKEKLINGNLELQNFVNRRVAELRAKHNFKVHDYYLGMDYAVIDSSYETPTEFDTTLVGSYDDVEITPDELLTYALNNNAAMYLLNAAATKAMINAHYEDVYCLNTGICEMDYTKNESAKMTEHINAFNEMKTQFEGSMYATYYTWEEYLYLAYGAKNMEEMLTDYYIKQTLQPLYIFDQIQEDDYAVVNDLLAMMTPYYDNYFSLNADHILIYVDRDEDGTPDDFNEFYDELTDTTELDALITDLEALIRDYIAIEENTFSGLISEYRLATRDDETWGAFKSYGLFLMTENLSSQGSLTYSKTINKYHDDFVNRLVEMYQTYRLPENIEEESLLDTELLKTSFGLHLIKVRKGTAFEMPSAKFTMTYNSSSEPEFTEGVENDSDYLNYDQMKLYMQYRFSVITFGTIDLVDSYGFTRPMIPSSVSAALTEFASKLHDALYVVGYLNIAVADELIDGTLVNEDADYFSGNETDLLNVLNQISNIYYRQIFLELDLR